MLLSYLVLRPVVQCQTIDYLSAEFTRNVTIVRMTWVRDEYLQERKEGNIRDGIESLLQSETNGILRV